MSVAALLIGIVVAGQVAPAGDRYSQESTSGAMDGGALEGLGEAFDVAADPITPLTEGEDTAPTSDAMLPMTGQTPASGAPPTANSAAPPYAGSQSRMPSFGKAQADAGGAYPPPGAATQQRPGNRTSLGEYPSQVASSSTGETAPTGETPPASDGTLSPTALMRAMLQAPSISRLAGEPITLAQVVSIAGTRDDQSVCIDAYWDLCAAVSDYYFALRQQEALASLRGRLGGGTLSPAWRQAESALTVRVTTAQLAALTSQYRLASLISGGWRGAVLPLPADMPHCGDYQTRYEENFVGRANDEARELAALLPLRYESLKSAGSAVTSADERLDAIGRGAQAASEGAILQAVELLALRRRAFVQIACDYNRRIARYAELATPGEIDSDRLVSMLIKSKNEPSTATRSSSSVPPFDRQSRSAAAAPPQTYAEGWTAVRENQATSTTRDSAVEQASAETQTLRKEKSLLVTPRGAGR